MNKVLNRDQQLDFDGLEDYLRFFLDTIEEYKHDWEISTDEIQRFNNELNRFKDIVNSSSYIPGEIKDAVNNISYNVGKKSIFKKWLRYVFLWRSDAYRLYHLEKKAEFETLEYDLNKILNLITITHPYPYIN
jgi:hypothetical protein